MVDGGVLVVRTLDDGINGAGILTISTVNAFRHVDVVEGGLPGAVGTGLTFDRDGIGRTGRSAELAGDASL